MDELERDVTEIRDLLLGLGMAPEADEILAAYTAIPTDRLVLNRLTATRMGSLSDLVLFPSDPDLARHFRALLSSVHSSTKEMLA